MSTTKGPWRWDPKTGQVDCEGGTIAHGVGWAPNGVAIAALPDVLDAAREALRTLRVAIAVNVNTPGFNVEDHVTVKRLREAIAKAEGRTP